MQDFAREALLFIVIKHLPTPNEELGEKISNLFEHKIGKTLEFGLNSDFFHFYSTSPGKRNFPALPKGSILGLRPKGGKRLKSGIVLNF